MHAEIYRHHPDSNAVVHTHADACVALACQRRDIPAFHYRVAGYGGDDIFNARHATAPIRRVYGEALLEAARADERIVALSADLTSATETVVTAENHSIIGGLGSAVAECLLEAGVHVGFERVGVRDCFAEGGSTPYLLARYGLDANAVVAAFLRAHGRSG